MLKSSAFFVVDKKDSTLKPSREDSVLKEMYDKTPWDKSIVISSSYPSLYLLMGYIFIDEKNYSKAINYLDTCVYIWEGFGSAWSELIYAWIGAGNFKKAKEIAGKALNLPDLEFDKSGKSAILRELGYIAIEENDLDKAEEYYNESLKYDETAIAKKELEYIKNMRIKQKK